jgi:uncharacterized protein YndB with AHSA1/START domain
MSQRSVTHATFSVDRTYDAPPERVFSAWSDPDEKRRWWAGGDESLQLDFQVGGSEVSEGTMEDTRYRYEARYTDIVPGERIIYTYEMHLNGERTSVSVATVEFAAEGDGTKLVFTEQGAFLDGLDSGDEREHGTGILLGFLDSHLAGERASA